jgi:endo-1,4-beta-xylanase
LCQNLAAKGLIDGIGMQGYWDVKNPSLKTIKDTIERFAETGLEIQLTEWSISAPTEDEAGFATQAERYASIFRLLQKLDTQGGGKANITCVSFFGVQDHYVLSKTDKTTSRLFDRNFDPKPVYYAIADTFKLYSN